MNIRNLLRYISLRRVKLQKVHAVMTVVGICLGVAAIISIGIVNKSVTRSFEDSINRVTGRPRSRSPARLQGFPRALSSEFRWCRAWNTRSR